ncbi:hypothetical protein KHM83_16610 [Fusibacter paucivorans]|uniref:Uncharacterized protein n=1 Tax=Fusibacter paucivorans TaxID=76009 RepID=A0ABS5PT29_9FIRM|nr:hypothetical protein [Fusibacter paucivorans]MBS7528313.1 hypothetical protein [Fusibacter paucivorans]
MEKSKLGISIQLTGAAMFFLGMISYIPALFLAAFVLMYEKNEWLRKSAVKMACVLIVAGLLSLGLGIIDDVFEILDITFGWIIHFDVPFAIDQIGQYVISAIEQLLLFILGLRAMSMGTVRIKSFEKIINTHM